MDEPTDKSLTGYERSLIENNAFELLESNPSIREAILEMEHSLIDEWASTDYKDVEKREKLWMKVNLLEDVLRELGNYYADGQSRQIVN